MYLNCLMHGTSLAWQPAGCFTGFHCQNTSTGYRTATIVLAVLLAIILVCIIVVGAVLLCRRAGIGQYKP